MGRTLRGEHVWAQPVDNRRWHRGEDDRPLITTRFGRRGLVFATMAIAGCPLVCGPTTCSHGSGSAPFFSGLSYLIAVPRGSSSSRGSDDVARPAHFETPMLFAHRLPVTFCWAPLGVLLARRRSTSSSTTLLRRGPLPQCAVRYAVSPASPHLLLVSQDHRAKLHERWGKCTSGWTLVGSPSPSCPSTCWVKGMPRRIAVYSPTDGFTFLSRISTAGAYICSCPWSLINSTSPAPTIPAGPTVGRPHARVGSRLAAAHHNSSAPPIRSERPVWT